MNAFLLISQKYEDKKNFGKNMTCLFFKYSRDVFKTDYILKYFTYIFTHVLCNFVSFTKYEDKL